MLSSNTAASLKILLDEVVQDTVEAYSRAIGTLTTEFVGRGALHSSGFTLTVDECAAESMKHAGEKLLEQTVSAHQAEATIDPPARAAQLAETLSSSLAQIGNRLAELRDARLKPIHGMPRGSRLEQSIPLVTERTLAKLQLRITAMTTTQLAQNTTINVNAPIGALQTGANSTASVAQTVHLPDRQAAFQALGQIEDAVKNLLDANACAEIVEMLQDLKDQTRREKPNPMKVSSLIGGMGGVIQTIPNIAPAWDTVVGWAALIRNAAIDIAGS